MLLHGTPLHRSLSFSETLKPFSDRGTIPKCLKNRSLKMSKMTRKWMISPSLLSISYSRFEGLFKLSDEQRLQQEIEREIQTLERDIRQQKESSVNAKTAITFDQLKKIHNLGKILGPQKEAFFDRICRAADIQRASLKNRLKQNKEKFEQPARSNGNTSLSQDVPVDSQSYMMSSPTLQNLFFSGGNDILRNTLGTIEFPTPTTPQEEEPKLPADRVLDLMQLGFSFDEIKQITEMFDQYKELMKPQSPSLNQVLNQFSNFISTSVPEHLKLISSAFNLLEMGYSRRDILKSIIKERRQELDDLERPCKIPRLSPAPLTDEMQGSDGEHAVVEGNMN